MAPTPRRNKPVKHASITLLPPELKPTAPSSEGTPRSHTQVPGQRVRYVDPQKLALPKEVTADRSDLIKAQEIARVEILMLKGVRQTSQIGSLLGIEDRMKVRRLMEAVYARWEITATGSDMRRHRGEALARLNLVENELWNIVANKEDDRAKVVALQNILQVHDRRMPLLGINPNSVAAMGSEGTGKTEFAHAVQEHRSVKDIAKRFLTLIEGVANPDAGMKTVNGDDE